MLSSPKIIVVKVLKIPIVDRVSRVRLRMKLPDLRSGGVAWRKSSFCSAGECAEVGQKDGMVLMRSTLAPRKIVTYTAEEFRALRLAFQNHEFDDFS
jgi:hypothetical protein